MTHKCLRCGAVYEDRDKTILTGCKCGSVFFMYFRSLEDLKRFEEMNKKLKKKKTTLEKEKVVRKIVGTCLINGKRVKGYEIHMGRSRILKDAGEPFLRIAEQGEKWSWQDGWSLNSGLISGTYVHGLFDLPGFRGDFLNRMRKAKGLKAKTPKRGRVTKDHHYDRLADHFEAHCDVERILSSVLNG